MTNWRFNEKEELFDPLFLRWELLNKYEIKMAQLISDYALAHDVATKRL